MKAFVISSAATNINPLDNGSLLTVPTPSMPSPKYALIKVLRAGICNTDLEILRGYMGFKGVLGHEFVGRVVKLHDDAAEEVRKEWLDVRVCGDINLGCCNSVNPPACGVCDDSLGYDGVHSNMSRNHCPNRTVLGILNQDGTFAGELDGVLVLLFVGCLCLRFSPHVMLLDSPSCSPSSGNAYAE